MEQHRNSQIEEHSLFVNINVNDCLDNIIGHKLRAAKLGNMNESSAAFRLEDIVTQLEEDIVFGVFHPKEKLTEPQIGTA
jgi:hypothetical protein